jgi:hypothetical protein
LLSQSVKKNKVYIIKRKQNVSFKVEISVK